MRPLVCRSPCLDPSLPSSQWAGGEENYWLMWRARTGAPIMETGAGKLWHKAVTAIYIEILAKSLVAADPDDRRGYWDYATALTAKTLRAASEVHLARCLGDDDRALLTRWRRLAIDLPI